MYIFSLFNMHYFFTLSKLLNHLSSFDKKYFFTLSKLLNHLSSFDKKYFLYFSDVIKSHYLEFRNYSMSKGDEYFFCH
jgi:uncharacterized damage-inducible protein DinB